MEPENCRTEGTIPPKAYEGTEKRLPIDQNSKVLNNQAPTNNETDTNNVKEFPSSFSDQSAVGSDITSNISRTENLCSTVNSNETYFSSLSTFYEVLQRWACTWRLEINEKTPRANTIIPVPAHQCEGFLGFSNHSVSFEKSNRTLLKKSSQVLQRTVRDSILSWSWKCSFFKNYGNWKCRLVNCLPIHQIVSGPCKKCWCGDFIGTNSCVQHRFIFWVRHYMEEDLLRWRAVVFCPSATI